MDGYWKWAERVNVIGSLTGHLLTIGAFFVVVGGGIAMAVWSIATNLSPPVSVAVTASFSVALLWAYIGVRKLARSTHEPLPGEISGIRPISEANIVIDGCHADPLQITYYEGGSLKKLPTVPYLGVVEFRNDPMLRSESADADGLTASLTYYESDRTSQVIQRNIRGIWTSIPTPTTSIVDLRDGKLYHTSTKDFYKSGSLRHSGTPIGLVLFIWGENTIQAVDSEHFFRPYEPYSIPPNEVHIKIRLTGNRIDDNFWVNVKLGGDQKETSFDWTRPA
jgi:hypothetical protein